MQIKSADFLRTKTSVFPTDGLPSDTAGVPAVTGPQIDWAQDRRFVYTAFPAVDLPLDRLAVADFKESTPTIASGTVLREPQATGEKAKAEVSLSFQSGPVVQLAAVLEDVPNQLLESLSAFQSLINTRMQRLLDDEIDTYVLDTIEGASPSSVGSGATTFETIRTAISDMREKGVDDAHHEPR